jgi:membrane fusion protein, multidrug efflux system
MTLFRRRMPSGLLAAILLLSPIGPAVAQDAPPAADVRPVLWVEAKAEHAGLLNFAGTVQPRIKTDLAFRTLGRVTARNVQVGDVVKQGDVLMEIDPLALQLAVRSAQADLNSAKAQLENARITEKRKETLAASNSISQAELELAQQGLISAQASVDKAQSSLDKAREQLGYASLKADFDGAITATFGDVGQTVASGQAMLTLARLDQRDAVVDVPEALLRAIRTTPEIKVELQLDPQVTARGVLREVAPEADATTRTHRLKIAIDNAPAAFRLGSVVTVRFSTEDGLEVIMLPGSALLHKDGKDYVWRIDHDGKKVHLTAVKTDPRFAGSSFVRILSGVARGDKIVAAGVDELQDGQTIRLGQERRT